MTASTISERPGERRGLTLERAMFIALAFHVLFAVAVDRWPGLWPVAPAAVEESEPLRFQFVDTPSTPAPEPPETDVLSDVDRQAADTATRDDRDVPLLEGDSLATVIRPAGVPPVEPAAPSPPAPESAATEPQPEEVEEETAEEETPEEEVPEEPAETPSEAPTPTPTATDLTPTPPSRPLRDLQRSLSRLEAFADPQMFASPDGGADQRNLAQFDTRGYDLGTYLREVLRRIEGNWRSNMPPLIRTGVGGATFIALSIRRERASDGREIAVIVAERQWTSGQPAYDTAARFSLELSSPLPPIPAYYPYDDISGRLGYIYNLDPDEVRFPEER